MILHVTDIVAMTIPIAAACIDRLSALGLPAWGQATALPYWQATALVIGVWYAMLWALRTRDARILGTGRAEYSRVAIASTITFAVVAIGFILAEIDLERWLFVLAFPLATTSLLLSRRLWREWLKRERKYGRSLARVVVVGPRVDVDYVLQHIDASPCATCATVGVVLDVVDHEVVQPFDGDLPVIAEFARISTFARSLAADAVVVAGTTGARNAFIRDLAWQLERTRIDLLIMSAPANVGSPRLRLRPMGGLSLVHVEIPQFSGAKHALKRAFDIAVSSAALVLLIPVLIALAVIIRVDSPGPAIFRQERVGRNGRPFQMLKFRSMTVTAPAELEALLHRNDGAGLLFKLHADPRITRVGRSIRKRSLDELPQFWNVLVGDMSLVGPRPPLPREVESYETHVLRRLYIRPGLTGMWQINGRSTLSWDRSVELDLHYVENWSVMGDISIMIRTLRQLTNPVGAF